MAQAFKTHERKFVLVISLVKRIKAEQARLGSAAR
jgi:hypothetical protein